MLRRPLGQGEALDWWRISAPEERTFLAPPEPMPAPEASFDNRFAGVGDLPCRKLFRRTTAERRVEPPAGTGWTEYQLGVDAARLEFSSFWHVPTHVQRLAECLVEVARAGEYGIRIETCGGARLWVDGEPAAALLPFTRNQPQSAAATLRLRAGANTFLLHMEELCERDTTFFVELRWLDTRPAALAVPGEATALAALRRTMATLRLDREAYGSEPVRLLWDDPTPLPLTFRLRGVGAGNAIPEIAERAVDVPAGAVEASFGPGDGFPQGYHELGVLAEAAGLRLGRKLAAGFVHGNLEPEPAGERGQRRRQALAYVAAHGGPHIGRALAQAATGGDAAPLVADALHRIERREDCSDFWIPPLLFLLRRMPEALPAPLRARAKAALLDYRYGADEPGNDVMWFWSENHALCFQTAQYLAGSFCPDELFGNSGRTGGEQVRIGRQRLESWLADVEAHGLMEWNSPAYYPIDAVGLLALHELAPDAPIRAAAGRCLDSIFTMMALSSLGGIPSSTQGRSYARDLKFPGLTETASMAWTEWGRGALNPMAHALSMLCLGSYKPPESAARLACWDEVVGVSAHYAQGRGRAASLMAWKNHDALLGSVVGFHPGEPGYQAVVTQLHLAGHPDARVWVNHPGEDDPFGTRRPSYWAGDGIMPWAAQWRNLAVLHYRLDDPRAIGWTHAHLRRDAFDEVWIEDRWAFMRSGGGVAAVLAANGIAAVDGPTSAYELRSPGRRNSWLLRVDSLERYGSLGAFAAAFRRSDPQIEPGVDLAFRDPDHGEVRLDANGRLTAGGGPRPQEAVVSMPQPCRDDGLPLHR
ncbi:MAG TPA: hypothetical protein PKA13_22405 [Geminicoccaceae bacterium]|nr:hypothetical protein [Geminicoccus sp.]HMU52546.1 hypothetical protein [Geminicoccaceae bacterium]